MDIDTDLFVRYITARQAATDARRAGAARPWSTDPIIATKKFCSVRRDDDRGSVEARSLIMGMDPALRERAILGYRLYNRPETLAELIRANAFVEKGIAGHAVFRRVFQEIEDRGEPVLSAAYKINVAGGLKNLDSIARMVHRGLRASASGEFELRPHSAMYTCHGIRGATGAGAFVCYQTMQDLIWIQPEGFRYKDDLTWAYPSTGAARGLARLLNFYTADSGDRDIKWKKDPSSPIWQMLERLTVMRKTADMSPLPERAQTIMGTLLQAAIDSGFPHFNMFEVEHNLCEVDKYARVSTGESKGSAYTPRGLPADEAVATDPREDTQESAGRPRKPRASKAKPAPVAPVPEVAPVLPADVDPEADEFVC